MQKDFSYPLTVSELPSVEQHYHLKANTEEKKQLAEILKVPEVVDFVYDMGLKYNRDEHIIDLWGHIRGEMMRVSVVSLESFSQIYDFDFAVKFDTMATYENSKEDMDEWADDMPEPVPGGKIDLVNVAIEQTALRMDDYPRKNGEHFEFEPEFSELDSKKHNPFEILSQLNK